MFSKVRDNCLQFVYEHSDTFSIVMAIVVYSVFRNDLKLFFIDVESKQSFIDMLLSLVSTLFGFILTFLSIFLVFKTDDKYKKKESESNPLKLFINNPTFNEIYKIFLTASYDLGKMIVYCIILNFIKIDSSIIADGVICGFLLLIISCTVQVFYSVYVFGKIINIVVKER